MFTSREFIPLQAESIITAQFRLDSRNMEDIPYCSSSRTQVLWLKAPSWSRHQSALGIDCVSSADRWTLETPPSLQAGGDGRNVAQRAARCFWSSWRLQTLLSAPLQCLRPQIRHRASFWASRQQITWMTQHKQRCVSKYRQYCGPAVEEVFRAFFINSSNNILLLDHYFWCIHV